MHLSKTLDWIKKLAAMEHRRAGSKNGQKTEAYLYKEFCKIAPDNVHKHAIPVTLWEAEKWNVALVDPETDKTKTVPSHYIPYTQFAEKTRASLIYAGHGKKKDLKGLDFKNKIVVVDLTFPMLESAKLAKLALSIHDPENKIKPKLHEATWIRPAWHVYDKAVRQGAVGFIGILSNQPGGYNSYYAPYGFKEGDRILDKPIPGFWIGKNEGELIRKAARAGQTVQVSLKGSRRQSVTHNIYGILPGESDEVIILASHHDSPFQGVTEDASGVATVLTIASELAARKKPLKKTVLFMATAGHFYGSIGTRRFIEEHPEIIRKTVAEIHIEHIAMEAKEKDGKLILTGNPEPAGIFCNYNRKSVELVSEIIDRHNLTPSFVLPASGPLGKYPPTDGGDFYEHGVPVFNMISNPVYLLVDADGMDKLCKERLIPTAKAFCRLIEQLDDVHVGELTDKHYPLKKAVGSFASWLTARKIVKQYGKGVSV
ncbi:MAG: M28 family peptidase [Spirochaetes bacterium]|nr:M28 family peptidase [Spirochaetota bacterium]